MRTEGVHGVFDIDHSSLQRRCNCVARIECLLACFLRKVCLGHSILQEIDTLKMSIYSIRLADMSVFCSFLEGSRRRDEEKEHFSESCFSTQGYVTAVSSPVMN